MSIHDRGDAYHSSTFGKSLSLKVDGDFNAISINPSARDVVLASRQGLYIIDLDDPFSPPRWLNHTTPWQVADVQWSPHPAKPHWVVSTSNQKAIIWNLTRSSSDAIEYALHGHSRAITDINFNPQHPDILATCSIDTYVHAWDLRSPRRPFYSTSSWRSSASQVKWNFQDSNILASSHGNTVYIWDLRNGSTPLSKLEGHESSVNSIDFNRFRSSEIMSSSNDGTVKFWNYANDCKESIRTVSTDFPIWRGRYLPFGEGCCVMPMVGGNDSIYLMNLNDNNSNETNESCNTSTKLQPIYTFKGHSDRIIDFLWRSRHSYNTYVDDREFELVTWSKDGTLRLWPISDMIYDKVNFERNKRLKEKLPDYEYVTYNREVKDTLNSSNDEYKRIKETFITTSGLRNINDVNHLNWLSGVRMNDQHSPDDLFEEPKLHNLGEEVSAIGHKFPKVVFEKISVSTGELILTLNGPWSEANPDEYIFLRIEVQIPSQYPTKGNSPIFKIEENSNLTITKREEILMKLDEIGKIYTNAGLYCLEQCLHYLLGEKVNMDLDNRIDEPLFNFDITNDLNMDRFSSLSDSDESVDIIDSSSDSDDDVFKNLFEEDKQTRNTFGRNLAFDSTPVPNECGAIWTSTGQLLCFFTSKNRPERKQHNVLKLTKENLLNKQSFKNDLMPLYDGDQINNRDVSETRPKRYVDTFSANETSSHKTAPSSDDQSFSDDSFGSFVDDWNDIVGNDIVIRTKIPAILGNFAKSFGSAHSESVKTGDSNKLTKNIILSRDFSNLISERRELALEYELIDNPPEEMARHNALVAEKYGLEEISHCWQILSDLLMAERDDEQISITWNSHSLGIKWFMKEAISYFEKENNLQMLGMLCCIIANPFIADIDHDISQKTEGNIVSVVEFDLEENHESWQSDTHSQFSTSNTINSNNESFSRSKIFNSSDNPSIRSDEMLGNVHHFPGSRMTNMRPLPPFKRPSNLGLPTSSYLSRVSEIKVELLHDEVFEAYKNPIREVLDLCDVEKCRKYIYQYAKLLFRWGLPMERVKILKVTLQSISRRLNNNKYAVDDINGSNSNSIDVTWIATHEPDRFMGNCNYCSLQVKGNMFVCGNCQHILHAECSKAWWEIGNECPSGCGCHCPDQYDVS